MIKNYIHIYISTPGRLNRLFSKTSQINDKAKQRGYDITTKSQIINFLCGEINKSKKACIKGLPEKIVPGNAHIVESEIFIKTLSDIESYIIQSNSCWELWKRHYLQTYNHVKKILLTNDELIEKINILHSESELSWLVDLKKIRNMVAHEGALYVAVSLNDSISNRDNWDLIFMKKNLHDFKDKKKYFTFKNLIQIHEGYLSSIEKIYSEIDNLIPQVKI